MSKSHDRYQGIKVTLITGFLGAGKTTMIQHLLSHVPDGEHWAVLINEFGDVGIDGALIEGKGIKVKQVPGGCLCCTTSAAFGAGLNELIKIANPDRIIIEPTGIGHPDQIVKQLNVSHYHGVLEVGASICLVDARNLSDPRYLGHPAFFDQINMADVLIASKQDTYDEFEEVRFIEFAKQFEPAKAVIGFSSDGIVDLDWLNVELIRQSCKIDHHDHHDHHDHAASSTSQPHKGVTVFHKRDRELSSLGWVMEDRYVFTRDALADMLSNLQSQPGFWRAKGVINTTDGHSVQVNVSAVEQSIVTAEVLKESRFECLFDTGQNAQNFMSVINNALF